MAKSGTQGFAAYGKKERHLKQGRANSRWQGIKRVLSGQE